MTLLTEKRPRDSRSPGQIRAAKTLYGDAPVGGLSEPTAHAILSPLYDGKERAAGLRGDKVTASRVAAERKAFANAAVALNVSEPTLRELAGALQDHIGALEYRNSLTRSTNPRDAAARLSREQATEEGRAGAPERAREALRVRFGPDWDQALGRAKAAANALEARVPGFKETLELTGAGNDPVVLSHLADIGTAAGLGK
jgi:hypothetical protein